MKVYFSHGKESGPWGGKITRLAQVCEGLDLDYESVDYTDLRDDPEARVARLLSLIKDEQDAILVGSSMGGYVSAVAAQSHSPRALFLLAPALFLDGYAHRDFGRHIPHTTIIHGWQDELIPLDCVTQYAAPQRANLHVLPDGHRLINVLDDIAVIFERFLIQAIDI